ncbi:MAG: hypothetical protein FWF10_10515 [Clostridiales bacterium]|nr:hypothetical protein [Clostridiales bacterium]
MNFAQKQAARARRNKIIWLALLLVFALGVSAAIYFDTKPFAAAQSFSSAQELRDLHDAGETWVSAEATLLFWSGYNYYTYEKGNEAATAKVVAWWYVFDINPTGDPAFIMVKMPEKYLDGEYPHFTVLGTARECDSDEWYDLYSDLIEDTYDANEPLYTRTEIEGWFRTAPTARPILVDMTENRLEVQIFCCLFAAAALLALFFLVRAITAMRNYDNTKDFLRMGGDDPERAELANQQLGEEFDRPLLQPHKNTRLTENWIVQTSDFGYKALPKTDLLWMYQHILQQRAYGVPAGKTYSVMLCFTDTKATLKIPAKNERAAVELMEQIFAYKPEILVGYNGESHEAYKLLVQQRGGK